jgi:hypothetical protein
MGAHTKYHPAKTDLGSCPNRVYGLRQWISPFQKIGQQSTEQEDPNVQDVEDILRDHHGLVSRWVRLV